MKLKLLFLGLVCAGSFFYFHSSKKQTSLNDVPSWYISNKKKLLSNVPTKEKIAIHIRMDDVYEKNLVSKAENIFNQNFSTSELEDLNKILNTDYKKKLVLEYAKAYSQANLIISGHINLLKNREKQFRTEISESTKK